MILPPPLPIQKHVDHLSVWQLVLAIIGLLLSLFTIAALWLLTNMSNASGNSLSANQAQLNSIFWLLGLIAAAAIPSIILSIRHLKGHASAKLFINKKHLFLAAAALLVWAGTLYAGENASLWNLPGWLIPLIDLAAVVLPILIILTVGLYHLHFGSKQRAWGLINTSAFLSIEFSLFFELLMFGFILILAFLWMSNQPNLAPYLSIFTNMQNFSEQSLVPLVNELTPYASKPEFYAVIIVIFCVLVPLIEELFKPLGVWFLSGKQLTPSQGFAAGLVCGAVFGVLESLTTISATSGNLWLTTAIARTGTGLLHTFTTGMSGWALAKTLQDQKYLRVTLVYLGMVLLHGTWNFAALLMGVSQLPVPINSDLLTSLMNVSTWALGGLVLAMFAALVLMNSLLRKQSTPPALPDFSVTLNHSIE